MPLKRKPTPLSATVEKRNVRKLKRMRGQPKMAKGL